MRLAAEPPISSLPAINLPFISLTTKVAVLAKKSG
jgi:hypothetical protein